MEELVEVPPKPDLRHRLFGLGGRLFAAPYLPKPLIALLLLVILSDNVFLLIAQPPFYWTDYSKATASIIWLQQLLAASPWLFGLAILAYLVVVGLLMFLFTRSLALMLWMALSFMHLRSMIGLARCGLKGISLTQDSSVCEAVDLVLVIVVVGLVGIVFARTMLVGEGTAVKPRRFRFFVPILVGGWLLFLAAGVALNVSIPKNGWRLIQLDERPSARVHGAMAYDITAEKALLFGGANGWVNNEWLYLDDTWEWNGSEWQQALPQTFPPGRVEHAMAFDESRGVMVLFGGRNQGGQLQDTWVWDGTNWERRFPENSPSPRCCFKMFFDSQRSKVVLYGGYDGVTFFNDGWEWDGSNWQPIIFDSPGPTISGFPVAYDTSRSRAVAHQFDGTWLWEGNSWRLVEGGAIEPPVRGTTNFAYDQSRNLMVLFGGIVDNEFLLSDTWLFDGNSWQELVSTRTPTARWGHALFYDASRQHVLVFGGFDGSDYNNDLWELVIPEELDFD